MLAFDRHGGVRAKDDRTWSRVEQPRKPFAEFELLFFAKEVEEGRSVDGGDVSSQFGQAVH